VTVGSTENVGLAYGLGVWLTMLFSFWAVIRRQLPPYFSYPKVGFIEPKYNFHETLRWLLRQRDGTASNGFLLGIGAGKAYGDELSLPCLNHAASDQPACVRSLVYFQVVT